MVRKFMGRSVNWKDQWKLEEEWVVEKLNRTSVAEEWSMGEEVRMKERRVTCQNQQLLGGFLKII